MAELELTQGFVALVDDDDMPALSKHRWHVQNAGFRKYAQAYIDGKMVYMHRFLMHPPKGMVVDHKNGEGLDNRRDNLHVVTHSENHRNVRPYRKICRRDVFSVKVDKWDLQNA